MDERSYTESEKHLWQEGMTFLSENPAAFGIVTDAWPVATEHFLVAAGGRSEAEAGVPTYPVDAEGLVELFGRLGVPELEEPGGVNAEIIRRTFSCHAGRCEYPVALYAAALAEMTALRVLTETNGGGVDGLLRLLGYDLSDALENLRNLICEDGMTANDPALFSVSLAFCRITRDTHDADTYILDAFSAGDYRIYLLDAAGLRPIRLPAADVLEPGNTHLPTGRTLRIRHPEPFAVVLLSGSATELSAAERFSVRENRGLFWRFRMRLEEYVLRVLNACSRAEDFGEQASRLFTGRAHGRDSASGALFLLPDNESSAFEAFHAACMTRMEKLESLITLLPDGYDTENIARQDSRTDTELAYIKRLLAEDGDLAVRADEAIYRLALDKLSHLSDDTPPAPQPADVPDYRRLTDEDIRDTYAFYDAENATDRALQNANCLALRDYLSDHWVTLRPYLLAASERMAGTAELSDEEIAYRRHNDEAYENCVSMNIALGARLDARRAVLDRLDELLSDSLTVLRVEADDWCFARATDDRPEAWARRLADGLPQALHAWLDDHRTEGDRYRSLLAAYTAERDLLFARDTAGVGFFAADWACIQNGSLPDERWETYAAALLESPETNVSEGAEASSLSPHMAPYVELWETLRRISRGTARLIERIAARNADRRMARDLAGRMDLRIAAIRASAYRDSDWGKDVDALLDTARRNNYLVTVRRWQETRELMQRRHEAYVEYRAMYEDEMDAEESGK